MKSKKKTNDTAEETLSHDVMEDTLAPELQEVSQDQPHEENETAEATLEDSLRDEIESLRQELAQSKETLLRRVAEFENIKKRMLRERMLLLDDSKIEAIKDFLPVNDDLQRTLQASEGQDIPASFLQGISMVAEKFQGVLKSRGVEAIAETGVPFDVNLHDAMLRRAVDDKETPSNTVLQVLEAGYKVGDRVIRHAKVIVSE